MKEKTVRIDRQHGIEKIYPEIRLSGKWLMGNGFMIGEYIRIADTESETIMKRADVDHN